MTTYYVDSASGTDGDGSFGDPWNNINGHINSLSSGDVLEMRGTNDSGSRRVYTEAVTITADGVTLKTYNSEYVVLESSGSGNNIIEVDADDVTIDGSGSTSTMGEIQTVSQCYIEFDKLDQTTRAINCINNDGVVLKYLEIHDVAGDQAVRIRNCTNGLIQYCRIHDCESGSRGVNGLQLAEFTTDLIAEYLEIYNCGGDCVHVLSSTATANVTFTLRYSDLYVESAFSAKAENAIDNKNGGDFTVHDCRMWGFRRTTTGGASGGQGSAIIHQNDASGGVYYNNEIYDLSGAAFDIRRPDVEIYRNVVHSLVNETGSSPSALKKAISLIGDATGIKIYNNTINGDHEGAGDLFRLRSDPELECKNNLFNDTGGQDDDASTLTITSSNNGWFGTATQLTDFADGSDVVDLDPSGDPDFIDEGGDDYRINTTSACVDAGTVQAPYTNGYNGDAPDIGYFETDSVSTNVLRSTMFMVLPHPEDAGVTVEDRVHVDEVYRSILSLPTSIVPCLTPSFRRRRV